jgi:transposase
MRKIRDVLRLVFGEHRSRRQVSASLGIPLTTVNDHVARAKRAGIDWPLPKDMDDAALERALFPPTAPSSVRRPLPDWGYVHTELRKKAVTLELLWLEYREEHPDGLGYSQFCHLYGNWRKKVDVTMRQHHRAGEKTFVDFAGMTIPIYDRKTQMVAFEAQLYVAVLGASNYTFAEALRTQELLCWITGHVHALEYFGGSCELWVPENVPRNIFRHDHREHPAEVTPGGVEAADDLLGRLGERGPHELMAAEDSREDERVAHAPSLTVGHEPEATEVNLKFRARRRVVDAHRDSAPAGPAAFHGEAGQGAGRDDDAPALEEDPDLRDGEVVLHPRRDLLLLVEQRPPRGAVAVGTVRAHPLDQLSDQPVGELFLAAGALDPELHRGCDVAPGGLAIDPHPPGDGAFALTFEPTPECLFDLDHRDLPERHGASSTSASEAQPNVSSAGGGGPSGWSHNWQTGWSHATGKTCG